MSGKKSLVPEDDNKKKSQELVLALDQTRQREIETIRGRMDDFLKGQLELKHEMEIVAENQKGLKERFEEGVSKRLTSLDTKFDKFMMEWGGKQKEDQLRDIQIKDVRETANKAIDKSEKANDNAIFYGRAILISIITGLAVMCIGYFLK